MDEKKPVYKRVLIKISGEALAGEHKSGLDLRRHIHSLPSP